MAPAIKFRWHYLLILGLLPGLLIACSATTPASGGSITGIIWQLQNVKLDGSNSITTINQPSLYTIQFQTDGTAHIRADCNTANFGYSISGYQLTMTSGPTTLVFCGPDSHSGSYLLALEHSISYTLQNDTLTINFGLDGYMNFKKA